VLADTSAQATDRGFKSYESAARALKIQLQLLKVTGPTPDLDDAFQAVAVGRSTALVTIYSAVFVRYTKRIADLAVKYKLPSMFEGSEFVDSGGLLSYSANDAENFRRAAVYVDGFSKAPNPPTFR
jgi:putative ABC transport system substrate-binding protein